ncbi:MAG TPA: hypothetical protein VJ689_00470 [Gaiellaceae bacterium]|jgi:mannose-6-phosphate isomerase-like protein (cupin superfamily)|nr:hypothetical protein [Gaiellaceae bacterium]
MADYTIKNIKDLDDQAESFGLSPEFEARFAAEPLGCEKTGMSYQRYGPNFRPPFAHRQTEQEELYVVVSGSGRMKLDEEIKELRQWDVVRVAPHVMRAFQAGPDGAEVIAFGGPRSGRGDAETVQGWWTDDGDPG